MSTTKVTELDELTSAADSDVFLISDVDTATSKKIQKSNITEQNFTTALKTKLDGIETAADVTDTANVTSAGALMDSEVTNLAQVKAFDSADYATAAQGTKADSALQSSDIGTSIQAYSSVLAGTTASFTTADETKLDGVETGATADQTAQEIATAIDADATAETTLKSALGLGTAAYTASTDYATAAQGTTADSATQPGDNVSTLTNDAGYLTSFTETDPIVGAVSGIVKANGAGTISAAVAGTDYLTPTGDGSGLTGIDALPSQTGNADKYLTTDGTNASWADLDTDANTTTKGLYEHAHTISANYSITSGNNAMSSGPITIDSGYSVTVPSGSTWTIV